MNKKDMLKIQPCVLRVNIHCEGCANKVKKKLQNVEGVYKVGIDVDQGKVIVSGNVDPAALIKKLEKAGKHAELWVGQKGGSNAIPIMMNHQFKNFQMEKPNNGGKDGKGHNTGKGQQQKGGFQVPKEMMQLKNNEFKDVNKFLGKDKKSVKFNLPEDEEDDDDDYFDESDLDDDGFDDEFDEGFAAHQPPSKMAPFAGHGSGKANKATSDGGHQKGKKVGQNGRKGEKEKGGGRKSEKGKKEKGGGPFDKFLKSMLGKGGANTGSEGKQCKKADKQNDSGKNSKKSSGFPLDEGKNAPKNGKGGGVKGPLHYGGSGKMNDNWNKKLGENFDGFPRMESKHPGFNNMNMNTGVMGQMPLNMSAMHAPPTGGAGAMNGSHFQGGFGQGNQHQHPYPYNNPQYMDQMRMMMLMSQQQQQQHGAYNHNLGYMPHMAPPAIYGPPPPGSDQYTHMFSDENTGSCSVM